MWIKQGSLESKGQGSGNKYYQQDKGFGRGRGFQHHGAYGGGRGQFDGTQNFSKGNYGGYGRGKGGYGRGGGQY